MNNTEKLEVLRDRASLEAIYDANAQPGTHVFFYKGKRRKWSDTYAEVQVIYADRQVKVTDHSNRPGLGVFTIGSRPNWYYSLSLFPDPKVLEAKIYELLQFSLIGESVYEEQMTV
ncbi:hypothetical protein [Reichenbachiella versicolor]|uniref:hypothetical protein n=1 Tax=Reichenbachiella versicolor TaxID=1821036 RepID=UPI000D6E2421|nr:hypothetical protein [Reichenbachiella versicolor]